MYVFTLLILSMSRSLFLGSWGTEKQCYQCKLVNSNSSTSIAITCEKVPNCYTSYGVAAHSPQVTNKRRAKLSFREHKEPLNDLGIRYDLPKPYYPRLLWSLRPVLKLHNAVTATMSLGLILVGLLWFLL